jgi:putative peptidoglycan lipid II flippase
LCGTIVIAAIPIIIVWRRDDHRWAGLALRLAAGLTLLVSTLAAERVLSPSLWLEPVIALVFIGGWLALMRDDAKTALLFARHHQV